MEQLSALLKDFDVNEEAEMRIPAAKRGSAHAETNHSSIPCNNACDIGRCKCQIGSQNIPDQSTNSGNVSGPRGLQVIVTKLLNTDKKGNSNYVSGVIASRRTSSGVNARTNQDPCLNVDATINGVDPRAHGNEKPTATIRSAVTDVTSTDRMSTRNATAAEASVSSVTADNAAAPIVNGFGSLQNIPSRSKAITSQPLYSEEQKPISTSCNVLYPRLVKHSILGKETAGIGNETAVSNTSSTVRVKLTTQANALKPCVVAISSSSRPTVVTVVTSKNSDSPADRVVEAQPPRSHAVHGTMTKRWPAESDFSRSSRQMCEQCGTVTVQKPKKYCGRCQSEYL